MVHRDGGRSVARGGVGVPKFRDPENIENKSVRTPSEASSVWGIKHSVFSLVLCFLSPPVVLLVTAGGGWG